MSQHYTAGLGCNLWQGHKWALSSLFKTLSIRGYDVAKLHHQISKIVVMTILPIVPLLVHNYNTYLSEDDQGRTCFELLGMDVLIDQKCKPWLLEVSCFSSCSKNLY
jgi:tubulin polyglutamylase TTLL6/13